MLHDLAQRHDIWPDFWQFEPWSKFDLAFLPGKAWEKMWMSQSHLDQANPKIGVFKTGWPKSDLIFKNRSNFERETAALRHKLGGLQHQKTILYAPSWENDGKQDDFVQRLKDLPVNLLLKQAPWSKEYPQVLRNIEEMNRIHRGMASNIHVVDPEVSIMYCIGISDLLVSDESSVLIEAALYDVPSVAVVDWTIPDTNPPRPACVPLENIRKLKISDLREVVEGLLCNRWSGAEAARSLRDFHFAELGRSSTLCAELILAAARGDDLPIQPLKRMSAEENDPDEATYGEALEHVKAGRADQAFAMLMQLASKNTKCWRAFHTLGEFAYQTNNLPAALTLFEFAVQKSPRNVRALKSLALVQSQTGDLKNAMLNYSQAILEQPDNLDAIDNLGKLLFKGDPLQKEVWHKIALNLRGR